MEPSLKEIRQAIRSLAKHPAFTAIAVITLALGIGANTAIFSVVNAVLLRPLPYKDSDRLVMVWEADQKKGVNHVQVSAPNYIDWRDQNRESIRCAWRSARSGARVPAGGRKSWQQPGSDAQRFALAAALWW
jgi:hypothetical protein